MYKIFSIILVISLSSCFSGNNVIVDEGENYNNSKGGVNESEGSVISERKVVTKGDEDFIIEDIGNKSNAVSGLDSSYNYQFSGLSRFSRSKAIEAVEELKSNNPDIKFVIYFEFDSSELNDENKQIIAIHNDFLQQNPNLELVLGGHTDAVGSRDYNLSLGELRALAVKKTMQGNISVVSFGEEKTVSVVDEKNRRVEFVYK
jgi:outer membrane protein OmpA-like peptidoglycan-associated protein